MFKNFINGTHIIDNLIDYLPTLLVAVLVFVIGFISIKIIMKIFSKTLNNSKLDITAHSFFKSLIKSILYVLLIVIVLKQLGIDTNSFLAIIGAAGLAIGLSLQNSMSNLAGGFIILFSKPFKVGDYIETGSSAGTVQSISILYTRLLTIDNKAIYIPNGTISSQTLVNYNEEKFRRLDIEFSISYDDDYNIAKNILTDIVNNNPLAHKDPVPVIRVSEQGASSISIIVKVWVDAANYFDLKYDLNEMVKSEFDKAGITIPFNQLEVTVKK